ncbi:MAG: CAP domain-containing protein [Myxococcales bacterium]|nr:CAP domain-containing protein [Myxococcales bacterium]
MLLRILLAALLVPASALADAGEEEPACEHDPALARAAAELFLSNEPPSAAAIERALRVAGSDLVRVRARLTPHSEPGFGGFLREHAARTDAALVCGVATSDRGHLMLIAARGGSLSPLSVDSTHVRGALTAGFVEPQLVVSDAEGQLERLRVTPAQLRAGIPIARELPRPARVQLLARGPAGPRPVAERVLPAASDPGATADTGGATVSGASSWQRLSGLRRAAGVRPLRQHRLLREVAQAHAERVCATGRVAHTLEPGGDPEQRLRVAGVRARRVGETVSRAANPGAAFSAFERSPSHRMTLLERGFTDAGIGEARVEERTCVVVLLAAWPRFVGGARPL